MRLVSLEPVAVRLPLLKPVKMAGIVIGETRNLLVRARDDRGTLGWGEAVAAPEMTGETLPGMLAATRWMAERLEGTEIEALAEFSARLSRIIYGNAAAKSAIDMAVHDLFGRREGRSLVDLLGGKRRETTPVLWMLASADLDGDVAEARAKATDGYRAFKVKVGLKGAADRVARDLERAAAVRAALGPAVRISADANEGFSTDEAVAFARGAAGAGLDFVEQPVPGHDLDAMAAIVKAAGPVEVSADEGLHTLHDIERHRALAAAHGGSLKILKLGGLAPLMAAGARAEGLGFRVNLAGKTAESSIASAANAHAAAALPQIDWDLSVTNGYLAADLVRAPLAARDGFVAPLAGPGLGVDVDEALVERFAFRPPTD